MHKSLKPFPPKVSAGLVGALRSATASIHHAVEELPVMVRLTSPAVGPADYRRYLVAMAGVYGSMEPPLFAVVTAGLPAPAVTALCLRPKYPALRADLAASGLVAPVLAPLTAAPHPATLSTALGGLYVLEGATLGGRIIVRQLRRLLGEGLLGDAFLDFHGEQASAVWKGFGQSLERLVADGLVVPGQTITAACAAFDRVYRRLAQVDMNDDAI
jgi:heme oxygenase (biliverdin-IX-beta and delta-forming)